MHETADFADRFNNPILVLIIQVNLIAVPINRVILELAGDFKKLITSSRKPSIPLSSQNPMTSFIA